MLYHPVKIGKTELKGNLFLAPVAGYSDRSFRSICVEEGAAFTYTEMVSAEALVRGNWKTEELMARAPNEKAYAVQIFGGEEDVMAQAAKIVVEKTHCEVIDINCGCPVPKIIKTGAGSALTRDPERLGKILAAVKNAVGDKAAVTVKIRSGWDAITITWEEAARAALANGADAITMHPRTRTQGYEGFADWSKLKALVQLVNGKIPVFGSGDLFKPEDAKRMLEETACDGVMFARGAMGNPFIFTKTINLLKNGSYEDIPASVRLNTAFKELELLISDTNEKHACMEMRKRFCAYSKGIEGGAELRAKTIHANTLADYHEIFDAYL
ncbi:MAG: tRNA dihydrouridine synthase DusB [Treponema sp.]|nr:tRNA dihydrouridine synthase DusB [Treponema sp.]